IPINGQAGFEIAESELVGSDQVSICPDIATCADCLRELQDPNNRRFRYPFINCTDCGPRLTIADGTPFDRQRTSMRSFEMCPDCRLEYHNPADRRYHAQPICCPQCGPKLELQCPPGRQIESADPLRAFADRIVQG